MANGTVDSVVSLIDGELRAGSQVAAAGRAGTKHATTDFAQRLGDAEPIMIGRTPYGVESLIGHLVASVVSDAQAAVGSAPGAVVLVHDDGLDDYRTGLWAEAGRLAGIPLAELTLLARSEALAAAGASGGASAASGAAKVGWLRHPALPGAAGSAGSTVAGAAVGGAAVVGGGIVAAGVVGGGQAVAAGPAIAAGPAGSALSAPAAGPGGTSLAGPGGTSLAGPGGTSLAGPGGTSLAGPGGTPLSGPVGTAIKTAGKFGGRGLRIPIIAGAAVAVGLGVVVVAASGDDPVTTARTTVVVDVTDGGSGSVIPAAFGVPACTIGTWQMDNDSFAAMWLQIAASTGLAASIDSVTGTVTIEVNPEGVWTSTYENWGFTSSSPEGITISFSITGDESSTGTFAEDGLFSFQSNSVNTTVTMTASAQGVNIPIPPMVGTGSAIGGTGNYICEGDAMTITTDQQNVPITMMRVV